MPSRAEALLAALPTAALVAKYRPVPTVSPWDPISWAGQRFYIPETGLPIVLAPYQRAVLLEALSGRYTTVVWSQIKKSGKTAIAGLVARWFAETWGRHGEIYCMANDFEQAQGRIFMAMVRSIELTPGYYVQKRVLRGEWRVLDREAVHLPSGTVVRALASDYRGEAGANPSLTLWSELWGFQHEASRRLWEELTPVPTRPNSLRWVETYAGFEGESDLLWDLYSLGKEGRQLTAAEVGIGAFEEIQNASDPVPVWVNDRARLLLYWDSGEAARRMPWQRGESGARYYADQAHMLRPDAFRRLHFNEWVSAESSFVPIEWWDACLGAHPLTPGEKTPIILGMDAAVTGDCFGIVAVSRHPERANAVAVRYCWKFDPPRGGAIDYSTTVEPLVREFCKRYNVVEVAYDPYQLHDMATRLGNESVAWFRPFSQGEERLRGDKLLYDLIRDRRVSHDGHLALREHIANANAKQMKDEDSKLRIIKKTESRKIDLAVALSMASAECLRLNL